MLGKSIYSARQQVLLQLLAEARAASGLTQVQLAKKLRTTQSLVSKIERGERRLDVIELHAWCRAVGKPFQELARELDERLRNA